MKYWVMQSCRLCMDLMDDAPKVAALADKPAVAPGGQAASGTRRCMRQAIEELPRPRACGCGLAVHSPGLLRKDGVSAMMC